jgi:hypothetical protein
MNEQTLAAPVSLDDTQRLELLGGLSTAACRQRAGDRLTQLAIQFHYDPAAPPSGCISLQLTPHPSPEIPLSVSLPELLASTVHSEAYDILTCHCGRNECAGFHTSINVAHDGEFIIWRTDLGQPPQFWVFDRRQYCEEILRQTRAILQFHSTLPAGVHLGEILCEAGAEAQRRWLESSLERVLVSHEGRLVKINFNA